MNMIKHALWAALVASPTFAAPAVENEPVGPEPGQVGGPGLAILASKVLTCANEGAPVVNHAVVLVQDGLIAAVGREGEVAIPDDFEVVDVGDQWLMPGCVELHCHVGGTMDINEAVFLTNPGLRASVAVIPGNPFLRRGLAGGVTSVLFIPGSATNVGGQGVLFKSASKSYDESLLRTHGSLKLAQAGNPERFSAYDGSTIGRALMNWNTRDTFRRGIAYAQKWIDYEANGGEKPLFDPQWDIFPSLVSGEAQVSAHTQIYQVSLMTCTMIAGELGIPVYIDHGTFNSHRMAHVAEEHGVPAILGPRSIDTPTRGMISWAGVNPERIQGIAAGYQENGHTMIGFNTDSVPFPFTIPQEELPLQAAVAVRYGFDDSNLDTIRGLTIVPAMACGLDDVIGSIEVGKHADILAVTGHLADPRTSVERIWIEGGTVYDTATGTREF